MRLKMHFASKWNYAKDRSIHLTWVGTAEYLLEEAKTVADGVCQLSHVRHQALHIFLGSSSKAAICPTRFLFRLRFCWANDRSRALSFAGFTF